MSGAGAGRKQGRSPSGASPTNPTTKQSGSTTKRRRPTGGSSPTKSPRKTREQIRALEKALYEIVEEIRPATVRQVFYQAVSRGLVDKTEQAYKGDVGRLLTRMRLRGTMPFAWIVDHTRWVHEAAHYGGLEDLRREMARTYRRDIWRDQAVRVEVWLEKQALVGVIYEVTDEWGVPLFPCRGYPSITYVAEAAANLRRCKKPVHIYYFGDHDPSGKDIPRWVEKRLRHGAPNTEIHFACPAVTLEQIETMGLPTRPTKKSDSRSKSFDGESVELDAIPPDELRELVRACIERHIDGEVLERTRRIEDLERQSLESLRMPQIGLSEDDHAY